MDALGFVMDNLGHFAPLDIANLLFAVLAATLLGYLLGRFGGRLPASSARELALWAAGAALGTGLVRTQLPLAVVLLALVILSRTSCITASTADAAMLSLEPALRLYSISASSL